MPATDLKIGTFVLILKLQFQKEISKKLQSFQKGPHQVISKPTEVTYKLTDSTKKEFVQHRNNFLPYCPKEYALHKLTQLYSFIGLKIVKNNTQIEQETKVSNDNHHIQSQKENTIHKSINTRDKIKPEKERKIGN